MSFGVANTIWEFPIVTFQHQGVYKHIKVHMVIDPILPLFIYRITFYPINDAVSLKSYEYALGPTLRWY